MTPDPPPEMSMIRVERPFDGLVDTSKVGQPHRTVPDPLVYSSSVLNPRLVVLRKTISPSLSQQLPNSPRRPTMTDPHFCRFCSFQMRRKTMLLFDPLVKPANVSNGQILFLLRPLPRCGPWAPVLSRAPGDTLRVPRSPSPFPPNSRGFQEEPEESLGTPSRALRGICRQVSVRPRP